MRDSEVGELSFGTSGLSLGFAVSLCPTLRLDSDIEESLLGESGQALGPSESLLGVSILSFSCLSSNP